VDAIFSCQNPMVSGCRGRVREIDVADDAGRKRILAGSKRMGGEFGRYPDIAIF
jgi:hypothetical protein